MSHREIVSDGTGNQTGDFVADLRYAVLLCNCTRTRTVLQKQLSSENNVVFYQRKNFQNRFNSPEV